MTQKDPAIKKTDNDDYDADDDGDEDDDDSNDFGHCHDCRLFSWQKDIYRISYDHISQNHTQPVRFDLDNFILFTMTLNINNLLPHMFRHDRYKSVPSALGSRTVNSKMNNLWYVHHWL